MNQLNISALAVHGPLGVKAVGVAGFQLVDVVLQDRFKVVTDRGCGFGEIPRDAISTVLSMLISHLSKTSHLHLASATD